MEIRKILFPTDFSEDSYSALGMAESLAKSNGATILILHVHEPAQAYGVGMAAAYTILPEEVKNDQQKLLEAVELSDPSIAVERKLMDGAPNISICDCAKSEGVDLIVMATHGRSGLKRLLMGSVAEAVVRDAPCPVLTLRTAADTPALQS